MERASPVTMTAGHAVRGFLFQVPVMTGCHGIPCHRQVIIFIDQPHIQACRAGLAMVAVHTAPHSLSRRKRTNHGVVLFFGRCLKKSQQIFYILNTSDTRQYRQHSRLIQCILDALIAGQRLSKRRCLIIQQLPSGKGFITEIPTPSASHLRYIAIRSSVLPFA